MCLSCWNLEDVDLEACLRSGHVTRVLWFSKSPVLAPKPACVPGKVVTRCNLSSKRSEASLQPPSLSSDWGLKCPLQRILDFLASLGIPPLIPDLPVMLQGGTGLQTGKSVPLSPQRGWPSFPQGLRNYEMWLWNNKTSLWTTMLESVHLFSHLYIELTFIDLHCHHSGPSHLCSSCRPRQLLPVHPSYRAQWWESLGGQRGSETVHILSPGNGGRRRGKSNAIDMCGNDRPFSPACQWWFGQSPLVLRTTPEGRKQVLAYFPAA